MVDSAIKYMDFDYLALYDENQNYEVLWGEDTWYHDLFGYMDKILAGESVAATGYLTTTGGKYIVFGISAKYKMGSGNAEIYIILTNGSYVLKTKDIAETGFLIISIKSVVPLGWRP